MIPLESISFHGFGKNAVGIAKGRGTFPTRAQLLAPPAVPMVHANRINNNARIDFQYFAGARGGILGIQKWAKYFGHVCQILPRRSSMASQKLCTFWKSAPPFGNSECISLEKRLDAVNSLFQEHSLDTREITLILVLIRFARPFIISTARQGGPKVGRRWEFRGCYLNKTTAKNK